MIGEYISHAHTPEEMKAEFCSDLRRRIAVLDGYANSVSRSGAERARIARASEELSELLRYWDAIKIERPKTKRELAREDRMAERKAKAISGSVTLPHISTQRQTSRKIADAKSETPADA